MVPLVLFPCAGLARAQNSSANYAFLLGSGFLCDPGDSSTCPATPRAGRMHPNRVHKDHSGINLGRCHVPQPTREKFTVDVVALGAACLAVWLVWPHTPLLRQLVGFVLAVYIFFWVCRFIILLVTALRRRKTSEASRLRIRAGGSGASH
jgi:hypothetical protein